MAKTYPGLSAWCNFKPGKHNWLDDNSRTFLNLDLCSKKGKHSYQGLFLNTHFANGEPNPDVTVEESDTHVHIIVAKKPSVKLFSVNTKKPFDN